MHSILLIISLLLTVFNPKPTLQTDDCSGAMPPHLTIGFQARVTVVGTGIDGLLRVRENAGAEAAVQVDMKNGDTFSVIDGPQCVGGLWWWQIVTAGGVMGWSAEGGSTYYFVEPTGELNPDPLPSAPNRLLSTFGNGTPNTLAWSPDGQTLAVGTSSGITLLNTNLEITNTLSASGANRIEWSLDGQMIAGIAPDGTVHLWTVATSEHRSLTAAAVKDLAWKSDSLQLATASDEPVVRIWDIASGTEIAQIETQANITAIDWYGNLLALAYGAADEYNTVFGIVELWDTETLTLQSSFSALDIWMYGSIDWLRWSPDGEQLAARPGGSLIIWNPTTQSLSEARGFVDQVMEIGGITNSWYGICWLPDSSIVVWAISNGGNDAILRGTAEGYLPNTQIVAMDANSANSVTLLDQAGNLMQMDSSTWTEITHAAPFSAPQVAWDASGQFIANPQPTPARYEITFTTITDGGGILGVAVELYEGGQKKADLDLEAYCGGIMEVRSYSLSPDESRAAIVALMYPAVAWEEGHPCLTLWDTATGTFLNRLVTPPNAADGTFLDFFIDRLYWTPDGHYVYPSFNVRYASAFHVPRYGVFAAWDVRSLPPGQEVYLTCLLVSTPDVPYTDAWSPDWTRLAVLSDNQLSIYDTTTIDNSLYGPAFSQLMTVTVETSSDRYPAMLRWSPDSTRLAGSSQTAVAFIRDAATGNLQLTLAGHTSNLITMAWSPDGTRLATGSVDATVRIWDTSNGQLLMTLPGNSGGVLSIIWGPDNTQLVAVAADRTARLWDVR